MTSMTGGGVQRGAGLQSSVGGAAHLLIQGVPVVGLLVHGIGGGIVVEVDQFWEVVRDDLRGQHVIEDLSAPTFSRLRR